MIGDGVAGLGARVRCRLLLGNMANLDVCVVDRIACLALEPVLVEKVLRLGRRAVGEVGYRDRCRRLLALRDHDVDLRPLGRRSAGTWCLLDDLALVDGRGVLLGHIANVKAMAVGDKHLLCLVLGEAEEVGH